MRESCQTHWRERETRENEEREKRERERERERDRALQGGEQRTERKYVYVYHLPKENTLFFLPTTAEDDTSAADYVSSSPGTTLKTPSPP
jgi:hypothetical protein